jgi:serine protease Do
MKNVRFAVFALFLVGAAAAAVGTLVAQDAGTSGQTNQNQERGRRLFTLNARGGQIGVIVDDLTADQRKTLGDVRGARIEDVDQDSPASKAGLREGDIVVEVDGERIRSARHFSRLIEETPDGQSVKLGYVRDGNRQTVDITPERRAFAWGFDNDLIGREVARGMRDLEPRLRELQPLWRDFRFDGPAFDFDFGNRWMMQSGRSRLGVQLESLSGQLAEYFGVKDGGVLIAGVTKDSPAEKAGLKAGDVITAVDGDSVRDYDDLVSELRDKSGDVSIGIVRDKKQSTVKATIEQPQPRARRPLRPGI